VLENRSLRRIFGPKKDKGDGKLEKNLRKLYSSPTTITRSRRTRWAGHVAQMGRRGMHIGFSWELDCKRSK
jgi:hypothetical protein